MIKPITIIVVCDACSAELPIGPIGRPKVTNCDLTPDLIRAGWCRLRTREGNIFNQHYCPACAPAASVAAGKGSVRV